MISLCLASDTPAEGALAMDDRGEQEMRFQDGNVSAVVRAGDTVRRVPGPWAPAVHALLRHLEAVGFDGAPRVLGFDGRGREILTFLPGATIPPSLDGFRTETVLVETAQLLRRYHDAMTTLVAPPDTQWRFQVGAPRGGDVICHNDIAPWNTVVVDGHPTGFIDWDFAAPGPRVWDIAHALWRFVPLYDDEQYGSPAEHARRMAAFCDAYGLSDRRGLLDAVQHRQAVLYDTITAWAEAGIPAFVTLWREGHAAGVLKDASYVRRHRGDLERHLGA